VVKPEEGRSFQSLASLDSCMGEILFSTPSSAKASLPFQDLGKPIAGFAIRTGRIHAETGRLIALVSLRGPPEPSRLGEGEELVPNPRT